MTSLTRILSNVSNGCSPSSMRESISLDVTQTNLKAKFSSQGACPTVLSPYFSVAHIAQRILRRMDLCEDPESQTITACLELPGIKPTDVEIQLHEDKLTVSGKRPAPPLTSSGARYPIQELKYGAFQRSINLPIGIQVSCP